VIYGYKYIITFLDKKSKFLEIKLLKIKSEVLEAFKTFKTRNNNQNNYIIKILKTNNGTKYRNKEFTLYLDVNRIEF